MNKIDIEEMKKAMRDYFDYIEQAPDEEQEMAARLWGAPFMRKPKEEKVVEEELLSCHDLLQSVPCRARGYREFRIGRIVIPIKPTRYRWSNEKGDYGEVPEDYAPVRILFENIRLTLRGHGSRSHVVGLDFTYTWPVCGCKIPYFDTSFARRAVMSKDWFKEFYYLMSQLLRSAIDERGEMNCPHCQVCDADLDYKCDGFEDIIPLSTEVGFLAMPDSDQLNSDKTFIVLSGAEAEEAQARRTTKKLQGYSRMLRHYIDVLEGKDV